MKIELNQFENKFKNSYVLGSRPIQDWQRVFCFFLAILIGVVIWSYYFYGTVQSEFKANTKIDSYVAPVKDKEVEIKELVDKYKAKEQVFNDIQTTTTTQAVGR